MSWIYQQKTGELVYDGEVAGIGYSGHDSGKNNPAMQEDADVGPIPLGTYTICGPRDTPTHGPFVMPLVPFAENQMFGRAGFLIHGDSVAHPGEASLGCIVVSRPTREAIWASGDRTLKVESGE